MPEINLAEPLTGLPTDLDTNVQRRIIRLDRAPGYAVLDRPASTVKPAEPLLLDGADGELIADL